MSLKVLVLSYDAVPGISAAGQHLAQLIPSLAERAEVDAMSLKLEHMVHIQKLGAARLMRIPTPGTHSLERIAAFGRAVHRQLDGDNYDLVICSDLFAAQAVANHPASTKMPMITDLFTFPALHNLPENHADDAQVSQSLKKTIQQGLAASTRIICHNKRLRKHLLNSGLLAKKLILAPLGLDTQIFSPPKIEIPADPTAACIVATVVERSAGPPSYPILFEQWSRLPQRLKLVMLTSEDLRATLTQQINMTGLSQKIQVKVDTSPEELAKSLCSADVQLCWQLPQDQEESPDLQTSTLVAYNALLCNRPVVTTGYGDLALLLGEHAATPGDQKTAIDQAMLQINKLAKSSALRARTARQGREKLLDHVNSERYQELVLSLAEQLCHKEMQHIDRDSDFDPSLSDAKPAPPIQKIPMAEPTLETEPTDPGYGQAMQQAAQNKYQAVEKPETTHPTLRTLAIGDRVDKIGENSSHWDHDTVAMTMPDIEETAVEQEELLVPGSRSMGLLNDVKKLDIGGLETEIMPREPDDGDASLEHLAAQAKQNPQRKIETDISTDETVRLPVVSSVDETSPPSSNQAIHKATQKAPLHTPAPIFFDDDKAAQPSATQPSVTQPSVGPTLSKPQVSQRNQGSVDDDGSKD